MPYWLQFFLPVGLDPLTATFWTFGAYVLIGILLNVLLGFVLSWIARGAHDPLNDI